MLIKISQNTLLIVHKQDILFLILSDYTYIMVRKKNHYNVYHEKYDLQKN